MSSSISSLPKEFLERKQREGRASYRFRAESKNDGKHFSFSMFPPLHIIGYIRKLEKVERERFLAISNTVSSSISALLKEFFERKHTERAVIFDVLSGK